MSESTHPSMTTPQEIGRILEDMANEVNDAFDHDTTASALIRHFHFIHRNITYLTQEVMRHQLERQEVYDYMMENPGFRTALQPLLYRHRQRTRRQRYHPYYRSPSPSPPSNNETPSLSDENREIETSPIESPPLTQSTSDPHSPENENDNSTSPFPEDESPIIALLSLCGRCMRLGHEAYDCDNGQPSSRIDTPHPDVAILERHDFQEGPSNQTVSQVESFNTAIDEIPGSKHNPIVIEDDKEEKCSRCDLVGHVYDDCNTPIRTPGECGICKWSNQVECNHYEPSPVWLRDLRRRIEQRERRLAIQDALRQPQ